MSLLSILLQNTVAADSLTNIVETVPQEVPYIDIFMKGGAVNILLLLSSLVLFALIARRVWVIYVLTRENPKDLFLRVKQMVDDRGVAHAKEMLIKSSSKSAYHAILKNGSIEASQKKIPAKRYKDCLDEIAQHELSKMENGMGYISLISGGAPMLGFLGTVMGMITAFLELSQQQGATDASVLATGIYQAMGTTFGGLIVGLIAYVAYSLLTAHIFRVSSRMDKLVHDFSILSFPDQD